MTTLVVHKESEPGQVTLRSDDPATIKAALAGVGVRLEHWEASAALAPSADSEAVLEAYSRDVARLAAEGYDTVDVVRLHANPDDADMAEKAAQARAKFRDEHTHNDDEVRFFVEGSGTFYLRVAGDVMMVVCEAGDLIAVPKGVRHWFDMGSSPHFAAIRFFKVVEGWVGNFTGDDIATRFPSHDAILSA